MAYNNYFSRFTDSKRYNDLFSGSYFQTPTYVRPRLELIEPYLHYIDKNRLHDEVDKFVLDNIKLDQMYTSSFNGMKKVNREKLIEDAMDIYKNKFPKELLSDMFNLYKQPSHKLEHKERNQDTAMRYKILDNAVDPINRLISEKSSVKSMIMTRNMTQYLMMMLAYQKQVNEEQYEEMMEQICNGGNQSKQGGGGGQGSGQQQQQGPQDSQQDQNQQQDGGDGDDQQQDQNNGGQGQNQNQNQNQGGQDQDSGNTSGNNSSKGAGKSSSSKKNTPEAIMDKLTNDSRIQNLLEEATNNAKKQIEEITEALDDQEMETIWANESSDMELTKESINAILDGLRSLRMNIRAAKEIINKLLNKSINYFHGKQDPVLENLWEASSIQGIEDYVLLHPKLRKIFSEDIMVRDYKTKGKINVYIDISGSMGSYITYNNQNIKGIDFAKSFAYQMQQMNLIENLYTFDTDIEQVKTSAMGIAGIGYGGGTSIETVVKHIEQNNTNAIIITDAEDHCSTYSSYAYFIGILGARFNCFDHEALKKYSDKAQMVEFDGSKVWNINEKGKRVK